MNILIPDSWLRDHLDTKATPKELKDYLSLCGPSIERVNTVHGETVYDIEVTTNRVDAFSVRGIAREASVILPEFGIPARLKPYSAEEKKASYGKEKVDITFHNDATLCYRILAIKIGNIAMQESPGWLKKRLELVGQRPLNALVDITNYVMWEVGHPMHVFDYDTLKGKKIVVRLAKKGEKLTTLNEKTHTLHGGEIVFDDGAGSIIDLPGIMGTANTVVNKKTKNALLFIENSDQVRIRRASMGLAIRSQAAVINEKHPDPELALVAMHRAIELTQELFKGTTVSSLVDIYDRKPKPTKILVKKELIDQYYGTSLETARIEAILKRLHCLVSVEEQNGQTSFQVTPPSLRSDDMTIPEDVIEEVVRIAGYHTIQPRLPEREPPPVIPQATLTAEEEIKIRLRDWGYTEVYAYSMISKKNLADFSLKESELYTIANPLSEEHIFLRPTLVPSMMDILSQNLAIRDSLALFELSHTYHSQEHDLPKEVPELVIAITEDNFLKLKGVAQTLFSYFGIPFPQTYENATAGYFLKNHSLQLGDYGTVGTMDPNFLEKLGIKKPVTILTLRIDALVANAKESRSYKPIANHPPVREDLSFVFKTHQFVGPVLDFISTIHPFIQSVTLLDIYEDRKTIRIEYLDPEKTLTDEEVRPIREKVIEEVNKRFKATLLGR